MHIAIKRVYDDPSPDDGTRVLIDRLWPRGLSKADTKIEMWAKDLAPSSDLRKWYDHDPQKHSAFAEKYRQELEEKMTAVETLLSKIDKRKRLTLLTATKELDDSQAPVLCEMLKGH